MDDPLNLLNFVCKMKKGYVDDKQRRKERDAFVDQFIQNRRLEQRPVNRESFAAFLKLELPDFENSDLHSQLVNAFSMCERSHGNPGPSTTKGRERNRKPRQRDQHDTLRAGPPRRPSAAEPVPEAT